MSQRQIFIGCDHAGFTVKKALLEPLAKQFPDITFDDLGTDSQDSVDYPTYAFKVARAVVKHKATGILICGSGIGVSIAANKVRGVRAGVCSNSTDARLSREHNDVNILCLGARTTGLEVLFDICATWIRTDFTGGRHQTRLDLLTQLEKGA